MTEIQAYKMDGLGNDFIIIDRRKDKIDLSKQQIINIADRKKAPGCDQIIIIDKDKNFLERNLSFLLNIFTLMVLILIFIGIALYAVQRRKYLTQKQELYKIDSLRKKLYIKDQLLHNTFELSNIGYWRLDMLKDTLFVYYPRKIKQLFLKFNSQ